MFANAMRFWIVCTLLGITMALNHIAAELARMLP